jgi:hypothetical protein
MGGAGLVGGTAAGGYTVSQPGSGTNKVDLAGPSGCPNSGAKPLQDPTSYNEHEDQERDNEGHHPLFGALLRQPENCNFDRSAHVSTSGHEGLVDGDT